MTNIIPSEAVPHLTFEDSTLKPIGEPEAIAERRFVSFLTQRFSDKNGKELYWDYAIRPSGQDPVAVVVKTKETNKYLFIVQPRIPMRKMVISFPAGLDDPAAYPELDAIVRGLVDRGVIDRTILTSLSPSEIGRLGTAVKELKEETGYEPIRIGTPSTSLPKSPGIITESDHLVRALVDEAAIEETEGMEETEDIKAFWMTPVDFIEMAERLPEDVLVEDGVYSFMRGYVTASRERDCWDGTVSALRGMCKERGIKNYWRMSKGEMARGCCLPFVGF